MLERIFISPEKSLPACVARWVVDNLREGRESAFFGNSLVLAPTKTAAKTLKCEVARVLSECGISAFAGLKISTPEMFFAELETAQRCAEEVVEGGCEYAGFAQRVSAWIAALKGCEAPNMLFVNGLPKREAMFETAVGLDRLRNALSENLMSFEEAARVLANDSASVFEDGFWEALAALEVGYREALRRCGLKCRYDGFARAMESAQCGYSTIVAAACPDMPAFAARLFERLGRERRVAVLIADAQKREGDFDCAGVPKSAFESAEIGLEEGRVFVYQSVGDEARAAAELAREYGADCFDALAVSCEQTENADIFAREFAALNPPISARVPEGRKFAESAFGKLVRAALGYCEDAGFGAFRALAENPLFSAKVAAEVGGTECGFLRGLDKLAERYLPERVDMLVEILEEKGDMSARVVKVAAQLAARLADSDDKGLKEVFEEIFADGRIFAEASKEVGGFERRAFDVAVQCLEKIGRTNMPEPLLAREILLAVSASLEARAEVGGGAEKFLPLQNWLEIFWSAKPHLLLCDFNDGTIPLAESEIMFLTDSARARLGLKNSRSRRARDAYMLRALLDSRKGGAEVMLSLKDASESPKIPSRILLQTRDLPGRVKFLFTAQGGRRKAVSEETEVGLRLDKPLPDGFSMSASKFDKYLDSPIDFYVSYVLGAREFDAKKSEFDALQYGTIFHEIMRRFALSKRARSTDAGEIYAFLSRELDAYMRREFADNLAAQPRMQLISMRQRFRALAEVQAERAAAGWLVWGEPERKFKFEIDGMPVVGSIDRIDRDEKSGRYCLIDYKTRDKCEIGITKASHLRERKGMEREWVGLQMPVYMWAVREELGADGECALFVSPLETSKTAVDVWQITQDELVSARAKMSEIIAAIRSGRFVSDKAPKYPVCPATFALSAKQLQKFCQNG